MNHGSEYETRKMDSVMKQNNPHDAAEREAPHAFYQRLALIFCAAIVLFASLFFTCLAKENDPEQDENAMVILPNTILYRSIDAIKNISLPAVSKAEFSESSDGKGYKTTLDVTIKSRLIKTNPVLTEYVNAFFSGNGGRSWRSQELGMDPASKDHRLYSFRSQKPGSGIIVSLLARNSLNGYMIELACEERNAPSPSPAFSSLNDPKPRGCFFSAETENPPLDDPPGRAGEDLDILDFRIGHNKKSLFFLIRIQGELSPGSITPTILHQYSVMLFDPEASPSTPEGMMPLDGVMLRYIPFGVSSPNFVKPCGAVVTKDNASVLDTKNVDCKYDGPFLIFNVNKSLWGGKFPRELVVFANTGTLRNKNLSEFSFVDFTNLTRVRFGARSYKFMNKTTNMKQ